jgi:putative phosphoesterase
MNQAQARRQGTAHQLKIGVISDTHGFLDPAVEKIFAGMDHILHAGDVGDPMIPLELEAIAPTTTVLGNTDLGLSYAETEALTLAGKKFLVHHIVNPFAPSEKLEARLKRDRPDVVVFGHTHKRYSETFNGVLYFNPGYSGKSRQGADRSVAILHLSDSGIRHEFVPLG